MEASRDELTSAYEDCIDIALYAFQAFDHDRSIYRGIILHLLSVDRNRLPGSWRESIRQKLAAEYNNQSETGRTFCERVIVKLGFKLM